MRWETLFFLFAALLMENCLKLEAPEKKNPTQPESVGLCLSIALPERKDEIEVEVPLQLLALETVNRMADGLLCGYTNIAPPPAPSCIRMILRTVPPREIS